MENLLPGDLYSINIDTFWRRMSKLLVRPKTDMYHFGMICGKSNRDYVILESLFQDPVTGETHWENILRNSVMSGHLSKYAGYEITLLRPAITGTLNEQQRKRELAVSRLHALSGAGYDLKGEVIEGLKGVVRGIPPWDYQELKHQQGSKYTCLGIVVRAWANAGFEIIAPSVYPTPSAIEQAAREGKLTVIFQGIYQGIE